MSTKLLTYILVGVLTTSFGLLGKLSCERSKLQSANDQLNQQLMQSDLEKGRALTRFGDAQKSIHNLELQVQKEIKERDALLTEYGELKARYQLALRNQKGSGEVIVDKPVVVSPNFNFEPGMFYKALSKKTLVPVKEFRASYKDHRLKLNGFGKPTQNELAWTFDYDLDLKFEAQLSQTLLPSGGINHYVSIWELDEKGKRIKKLDLEKFEVVIQKPDHKKFHLWNPKLDIGGLALFNISKLSPNLGGSIGLSIMSYGLTSNDLDWRFGRLSIDFADKDLALGFTPALYNIGQLMPVLSNIWIGPHVNRSLTDWSVGLFLGAQL